MNYQGSCHCGQITFEAEGEIEKVMACNCSVCQRKGSLLWFIQPEKFRLLSKPQAMSTYTLNKHVIRHHFCPNCGIHPFAEGELNGQRMVAVNVRCLEGVEIESLQIGHFDGRAL
jgi:hypothetical protein